MDRERGKLISSPQGSQVSQGQVEQASRLFSEGTSSTPEWVEIHRTSNEWEVKLIQATLGAQQIRCRPIELRAERQTVLLVEPEHQVTAMELVSRIGVAITDHEMAVQSGERAEALKQRDMVVVQQDTDSQVAPSDLTELILAERESIGKVVYITGQGYELRVGLEPYVTIPESDWEEFTDFSAQRQEFVILLRREYPALFEWIRDEKLLAEFIRLIEMTYQDGAPTPISAAPNDTGSADDTEATPYNTLAKFSLTVAVISLFAVLFQVPWYVNLVLAVVAVVSAVVAKYQVDASAGESTGIPMALGAIVLACLVAVFAWWLSHQPQPAEQEQLPVREMIEDR